MCKEIPLVIMINYIYITYTEQSLNVHIMYSQVAIDFVSTFVSTIIYYTGDGILSLVLLTPNCETMFLIIHCTQ